MLFGKQRLVRDKWSRRPYLQHTSGTTWPSPSLPSIGMPYWTIRTERLGRDPEVSLPKLGMAMPFSTIDREGVWEVQPEPIFVHLQAGHLQTMDPWCFVTLHTS